MAPKGLKTFAIEAYNLLASGSSSVVDMNDFDIYYDNTTGNILAVDFSKLQGDKQCKLVEISRLMRNYLSR